nr:MAG TPA: hypothetical protein [Caudoviricetes sp.]
MIYQRGVIPLAPFFICVYKSLHVQNVDLTTFQFQ